MFHGKCSRRPFTVSGQKGTEQRSCHLFSLKFETLYTHVFAFPPLKNVENVFLALERRPANGKCGKCRSRDPPFRLRGKKIGSALRI